ncbi:P-loop containing nucleoside triphosphate hydrolase protein, partial [Exidia glandulosa HHB12029]
MIGVDEGHLLMDWGLGEFRIEYANLGLLRSYCDVPILVVSATLPPSHIATLSNLLHLGANFKYINLGNTRDNLFWEVRQIAGPIAGLPSLRFLLPPTVSAQTSIPQTLIFVPERALTHRVANYLRDFLPHDIRYNAIVSLHAMMRPRRKNRVLASFDAGVARIMVCTTIAALGRDFRSVTRILAYQIPQNLESWVQEAGRGARNAALTCHAILMAQSGAYTLKDEAVALLEEEE